MSQAIADILETVDGTTFRDGYDISLLANAFPYFCFKFNFSFHYIKRFVERCMGVRTRAATRRYQHVNYGKLAIGLFSGDNNAIGVANYGKMASPIVIYFHYV